MHGVPKSLPLDKLHGLFLCAICPLENIVYFDFAQGETTKIEVGIEGR